MLHLIIFITLQMNINSIIGNFYTTECENHKKYYLYSNLDSTYILNENEEIIFSRIITAIPSEHLIKGFYCYDNELYVLVPYNERASEIYSKLELLKINGENYELIDTLYNTYEYFVKYYKTFIVYYDYEENKFFKVMLKDNFNDKTLIGIPTYNNFDEFYYLENPDRIIYENRDGRYKILSNTEEKNIPLYLSGSYLKGITEKNGDMYFLYFNISTNKLTLYDKHGTPLYNLEMENNENLYQDPILFSNETGFYFFTLTTPANKLLIHYISPQKSGNKYIEKNVSTVYKDGNGIYFIKILTNSSKIFKLSEPLIPAKPEISDEIQGVLNNFPAGFSISNLNQDTEYFVNYEVEISPVENFNSVYYGDTQSYYNKNSSYQYYTFSSYFSFRKDTPYYMRVRYNTLTGSSEYNNVRFIITDLGKITEFKIKNIENGSELFTKSNLVKGYLKKEGNIEYIEYSYSDKFNNSEGPLAYEDEINIILPSEEGEYTVYLRPVAIDNSNNNIMGSGNFKKAKIIFDKTPPSAPVILTPHEKEFSIDKVKIEWKSSTDNISGIKNYLIKLTDSLNNEIENTSISQTSYTPSSLKEGIYTFFLKACDKAENCSEETKINFKVSKPVNHKPYKPEIIRPSNKETISSMPFTVNWKSSEDPDEQDVTYSLIISRNKDFKTKEIEIHLLKKTSYDINYLSQGNYFLKLYATDTYGLSSNNEIIEFDVIEPSENETGCGF